MSNTNTVILIVTLLSSLGSCIPSDSKNKASIVDFEKENSGTDGTKEIIHDTTQLHELDTPSSLTKTAECEFCDIWNLKKLRQSLERPNEKDLLNYLICCNEFCHSDIEYSQASNYSLFLFFLTDSEMMISLIRENEKILDINFINSMLQNPVEESIDIEATYTALVKLEEKDTLIEKFLASLEIAKKKSHP